MMEILSTMISAVSLLFSRLDRRADGAVSPQALKKGLLQLEALLTRWVLAARRTNEAYTQGEPEDLVHAIVVVQNVGGALKVSGWLAENDDENENPELRQLFDIYAPEIAARLRSVVSTRTDLLSDFLEAEESAAREGFFLAERADQLAQSLVELEAARSQVRSFIAENFPLSNPLKTRD